MTKDSIYQYGYNRDFLKKYVRVIELKNYSSAIAIVPEWQGRVMTSAAEGETGFSFGWINHNLISSGKTLPHINAFGGEERLWIGPEGGQFSVFNKAGASFRYDDWQTPAFIDTEPFEVTGLTDSSASFARDAETENYSKTKFRLGLERDVILMGMKEISELTGVEITGLNVAAYRTNNRIINKGVRQWKKETGLLSVWMLGMFNITPSVVVVIPFRPGDDKLLGPPVNDDYFGRMSADRLIVKGNHIFFRIDGKDRKKIGLSPLRARGIMGSYDSANNILNIVKCNLPEGITDYVNNSWHIQDEPYSGDALNSYNDGPLEDGSQMGPFYELESLSPAVELKPGEHLEHDQVTMHLTGEKKILDQVSLKVLGVSLDEIRKAFL